VCLGLTSSAKTPLQLTYKRRLAALSALCSPLEINPVAARLSASVRTLSLHRNPQDPRRPLVRHTRSLLPLQWIQPRPRSKNCAHLPIDVIAYSMLFLSGPEGDKPPPMTFQSLLIEPDPDWPPDRSYPQLKQKCSDLLMEEWRSAPPDPATRYG